MPAVRTAPEPYLKPLPATSEYNEPFWAGLRRHEFLVPRCRECSHWNWLPYPACRSCFSENLAWTAVSGQATVYSFTTVFRGPGAFALEVPYVMCLGQLVEQPRACNVLANLTGVDPERVSIGMPIEIGFVEIPHEDITMYEWLPRRQAHSPSPTTPRS